MSQKHIYNSSEGLVLKSLRGAVALNPSLRLHTSSKTVYVDTPSPNTLVSVITGGGAGHEPAHASYTGYGMLAASVSGDIFASPSAKQISSAIRLATYSLPQPIAGEAAPVDSQTPNKSVLVIINNYTGDRLNFGLAIEKARAEGIDVESVVVADDVSLLNAGSGSQTAVGPRGLAGNILICKLLGAFAERGALLCEVKALGDAAVDNLASIGVGLEHCHVPGRDRADDVGALGSDECELGLGLHNEPGVLRMKLRAPDALVEEMVRKVLASRDVDAVGQEQSSFIGLDDEVVLFVNNLGGVSQLEMVAVLDEILLRLAQNQIYPARVYLSSFMTSLNAPGFSLSLLNVSNIHRSLHRQHMFNINILQLLDDPTDALSWIGVRSHWPKSPTKILYSDPEQQLSDAPATPELPQTQSKNKDTTEFWLQSDILPEAVTSGIIGACRAVLDAEKVMTEYDTIVGDGDCGTTFARGAKAILSAIDIKEIVVSEIGPSEVVRKIGDVLEDHMGGTIGALFAIFFTAWSSALSSAKPLNPSPIAQTLQIALGSLSHHTPAKPGDRTIMDALYPFCQTLTKGKGMLEASIAAKDGAMRTRGMQARLGRAVYVGNSRSGVDDGGLPPDPGAWGVAVLVEGFMNGFPG